MSLYRTGVREVVDNFLLEESRKKRDYGKYWSASSAGYCMREQIFKRLGVPPVEEDARKQRVFTSGHIFHEWIQGVTKQAGLSVAQEKELINDKIMVKGHFDDLIKTGSGLILYDYKTVHSGSFKYKTDTAGHFHTMQVGTYLYMLKSTEWKTTQGRILLISKDDLRMKEQLIELTPQLEKQVVSYWTTLNGYWKAKKLPQCNCADFDGGFKARQAYNDFYYNGEPCSMGWYNLWKENQELKNETT